MILWYRIDGFILCIKYWYKSYNLLKLEEDIIVEYIFNIYLKGFSFKFKNIEDMVNYIFELRDVKNIGKFWIYWFVKYWIELKMYFNCIYDFQRAFYKNSKLLWKNLYRV